MEKPIYKICLECNSKLPATIEFWHKQKNGKYGLRSQCKKCSCERVREYRKRPEAKEKHRIHMLKWRKENPEKALDISRKNYKLHGCKQNEKKREKYQNDELYRQKCFEYEKKYKESGRRHESNCKPQNRESARIRSRERRLDKSKKEHDLLRNKEWREKNKEHIIESDKKYREALVPSYIALSLRTSVKELPAEVLETRRIIIKLKRELKNKGIKIK